MSSGGIGAPPFEWIINSNALGVGFLSVIVGDGTYLGVMVTCKDTTDLVRKQRAAAEFKDTMSAEATRRRDGRSG